MIVVVNLDPHAAHEVDVELPLATLGLAADRAFSLEEAFTRTLITCRGALQRFRLDPQTNPALIFRLLRNERRMSPPDDVAAALPLSRASARPATSDPSWYKDAIIYQLHVKAFFDADDDGIGDFRGLCAQARLPAGPRRHRACGCCRSIPRRCATTATTFPTTRTSTRPTGGCTTSSNLSARRTAAICGSSPSS